MKKSFLQIFKTGIKKEQPEYLSTKIYVSNVIAVITGLLVALPYSALSYFFFRPIIFIPLAAVLICLIVIILNYVGSINISRLVIGILPMSMGTIFVSYLIEPGGDKLFEFYAIAMGFSIIPFLVFDLREKIYLSVSLAYIVGVLVFGNEWLITNLNKEIDVSIIVDGPLGPLNIFMGVTFMIIGVLVLSFENYKSEKKSISLVYEMDLKTEEIKNSENELKNKIAQIEINQAEEKKRNWASVGIAEVSTLLRSDSDSQMLYNKITSYISEYMGANQCALFLVEKDEYDEEVILKLHSCYAYDRKKYFDKDIQPGQGQIGQAYLERSTIYLKDVPEGYANITSGMGKSTAKEVLIVPLVVNDQVEGIFEFASFKEFEQYQISFIEQLGETLAAFININRINERTKLLLEESQQQAEEMRSQEEEMRQNMEELSATQEEMGRKEQGYVDEIEELTQKIKLLKTGVNS